jgi:hypothetical protein
MLENLSGSGVVAHTYNSSYSGGRNQEDCGLRLGKKLMRPLSQQNKPGMNEHTVMPAMWEAQVRGLPSKASLGKK